MAEKHAPVYTSHLVHRYGGLQSRDSELHRQHGDSLSRDEALHSGHGSNLHDGHPQNDGWGEVRASLRPRSHDDSSRRDRGALGSDAQIHSDETRFSRWGTRSENSADRGHGDHSTSLYARTPPSHDG